MGHVRSGRTRTSGRCTWSLAASPEPGPRGLRPTTARLPAGFPLAQPAPQRQSAPCRCRHVPLAAPPEAWTHFGEKPGWWRGGTGTRSGGCCDCGVLRAPPSQGDGRAHPQQARTQPSAPRASQSSQAPDPISPVFPPRGPAVGFLVLQLQEGREGAGEGAEVLTVREAPRVNSEHQPSAAEEGRGPTDVPTCASAPAPYQGQGQHPELSPSARPGLRAHSQSPARSVLLSAQLGGAAFCIRPSDGGARALRVRWGLWGGVPLPPRPPT